MIETNKLTSYQFSDLPATVPGTWDLSPYIPEGVLLLEHLQYRWRMPTSYWTNWQQAVAFDANTQVATAPVPNGAAIVEFKRSTPRDALVRDPQSPTSRVAQPDLQINADQGMMVAIEWAAEYGVDGHAALVSGEPPRSLGLVQHSQNHYSATANYYRKVWDFRFTGGYIDRTHVKVQIKVDNVWQAVDLDYSEWDHENPSGAPFRFQDNYQLYLDFGDLIPRIQGMVIYRRTPREYRISTPPDRAVINGDNMYPTATHAFFVAVELGEEMNRLVPECECQAWFTSKPYAAVQNPDSMTANVAALGGKIVPPPRWKDDMTANVALVAGELRAILQKYQQWPHEDMSNNVSLISGELKTILKRYGDWPHEDMTANVALVSGTLKVILVRYSNWPHEDMTSNVALISGTLT